MHRHFNREGVLGANGGQQGHVQLLGVRGGDGLWVVGVVEYVCVCGSKEAATDNIIKGGDDVFIFETQVFTLYN